MNKLIMTIVSVGFLGYVLIGCSKGEPGVDPATAENRVAEDQMMPKDKGQSGGAAVPDFAIDGQGGGK